MSLLIYIIAALIGIIIPVRISFLLRLYIIFILFDEYRFLDVSITNIFSIFLTVKILLSNNKFKLTNLNILLLIFLFLAFVSFITTLNDGAFKFFASLFFIIINTILLTSLVEFHYYRNIFLKSIFYLSLFSAISVIFEAVTFYIFHIQLRDSNNILINLSANFYFSSGLYDSNGIAAFHILPGITILLFRNNIENKPKKLYFLILLLGIILAMSRGAIIITVLICILWYAKYLKKTSQEIKLFGYTVLSVVIILSFNLIIFISNFNISSIAARVNIIYGSLNAILNNPLVGKGIGSMVVAENINVSFVDYGNVRDYVLLDTSLRETHNTFLQVALEMGIFALICFILIIINLIRKQFYNSKIERFNRKILNYHYISYILLIILMISININSYLYIKLLWLTIAFASFTFNGSKQLS